MSIITAATEAVTGERNQNYGDPLSNHATTGSLFAVWMDRWLISGGSGTIGSAKRRAVEVCVFNICQKLSRLANSPEHYDSLVDIVGYAQNLEMILHPEEPEELPF